MSPHHRRNRCLRGPWRLIAGAVVLPILALPLLARDDLQSDGATPASRAGQTGARTSPVLPPPEGHDELSELLKEGATMEEIARLRDPVAKNPEEAMRALKVGNARFFGGTAQRPELNAMERRAQILAQHPFAVILGCSDSRVPTEIVFDQSLGSLFVVRVAGNVVEPATAGSVEYAAAHLKSQLIVVLGHEGCGAVGAAMLPKEQRDAEPENVRFILDQIEPAVKAVPELRDKKARMREAVIANVRLQVHRMKQNPVVSARVKDGKLAVIGAYYEITSGAVDFLETEEELRLSAEDRQRVGENLRHAAEQHARHRH
ncbi:MAG: carbonic anhydrase [Verrucomicrobiota bacterium]|nr:carbonic anhydrase [Verrucomicrobiota bacterium]